MKGANGHGAEAPTSARPIRRRLKTVSMRRLSKADLDRGRMLYPETYERPKTRGECVHGPRPCPFVSCRYHLFLDVQPHTGALTFNFPGLEVEDLDETCALDVAARGDSTLDGVSKHLNVTRERVRQIEAKAAGRLRRGDIGSEVLRAVFEESLEREMQATDDWLDVFSQPGGHWAGSGGTPPSRQKRIGDEMGRKITANGETHSIAEWAKKLGLSGTALYNRLRSGWTELEAVTHQAGEVPERLKRRAKKAGASFGQPAKAKKRRPRKAAPVAPQSETHPVEQPSAREHALAKRPAEIIAHRFPLRPGLCITVELPVDLKPTEAGRLKKWIDVFPDGEQWA